MPAFILHHGIRIASDFTPETFGRLTTIGPKFMLPVGSKGVSQSRQVCQCSCGNIVVCKTNDLRTGHTSSCGCLHTEQLVARSTKHGHSKRGKRSPEYSIWAGMLQRCHNPNNEDYRDYGAKGIYVCPEWHHFAIFLEDMGPRPSDDLTIDRIDTYGPYCKENCRWATVEQQMNNRTDSRYVTAFGKTQTVAQWSRETGINEFTIRARLVNLGWSPEDAVSRPISKPQS